MFIMFVFTIIGAIVLFLALINFLWSPLELISSYLMPYFLPAEVQSLTKRFGTWAAVTGCTDGIGRQYALQLAARGLHVALISRSREKLDTLAAEIEKTYKVKTKVIVADFIDGPEVYTHIEQQLKDIPLGILVNNVGLNYECPVKLCEETPARSWQVLTVNTGAVTMMSRLVLPGMAARGRGALVNVSSASELQPLPMMAVYAATKAYIGSFTHAIRAEYAPKGIYVQHVSPYFISTRMNAFSQRVMQGNLLVPDVETYGRHAVATLGRVHDTTGYWAHGVQYTFVQLVPAWVRTLVGHRMNRQFRKEYIQQEAKLQ